MTPEELIIPVTEIEVAELLSVEGMPIAGANIIRRMAFELGKLKADAISAKVKARKEEFISKYCHRIGISIEVFNKKYVVLPCNCGEQICTGLAAVKNNKALIDMHNDLYT